MNIISLPLTGEDDHGGAQQQVDSRLPPGRHTGHCRWDEDLRRDVELQRKGDEDAKAVEKLHDLVRPGGGRREGQGRDKSETTAH